MTVALSTLSPRIDKLVNEKEHTKTLLLKYLLGFVSQVVEVNILFLNKSIYMY